MRLKYIILSILLIASLSVKAYKIGDVITNSDGSKGVVFYLDPDGFGGWMVAIDDACTLCAWSSQSVNIAALPNYTGTNTPNSYLAALEDTSGYANTKTIRQTGTITTYPAAFAVDIANGWYLPAAGQLRTLFANLLVVSPVLIANGGTDLSEKYYLSSSEYSNSNVWSVRFQYGDIFSVKKSSANYVRAVRSFSNCTEKIEYDTTLTYLWNTGVTEPFIDVTSPRTTNYEVTATSNMGCQAKAAQTIIVNTGVGQTIYDTICAGEVYNKLGFSETISGTYNQIINGESCTETLTLHLTVNQSYKKSIQDNICQGEYYNKNGFSFTPNISGLLQDTMIFSSITGCDSMVILDLNVLPISRDTIRARICQNESYVDSDFDLPAYMESGLNYHTIEKTTANGCKSYHVLALQVDTAYQVAIIDSACMEKPYIGYGFSLPGQDETKVHQLDLKTIDGCDSIVRLKLIVTDGFLKEDTFSICNGDSILWREQYYKEEGVYTDSLLNQAGCDSIHTLHLNVYPFFNDSIAVDIKKGKIYSDYGFNFVAIADTVLIDSMQTVFGCDSILTIILSVRLGDVTQLTDTICNGETYSENGFSESVSGIYIQNLQTIDGADSTVVLTLTVMPIYNDTIFATICQGEAYTENGFNEHISGIYTNTEISEYGCDSLTTLVLTVNPIYNDTIIAAINEGDSYTLNGFDENETGKYVQNLQTIAGCDSVVVLDLTVYPAFTIQLSDTICNGKIYSENGFSESVSGIYIQNLQTIDGADSTVVLTLTVMPIYNDTIFATICQGEAYTENGFNEHISGIYTNTEISEYGCDSLTTLVLTVNPIYNDTIIAAINEGDSYTLNGFDENETEKYVQNLQTIAGCDSVVVLDLTVYPAFTIQLSDTICNGETYSENGFTENASGIYIQNLQTVVNGSDSTVVLTLTVMPTYNEQITDTICIGDDYNGYGFNISNPVVGIASHTLNLNSQFGCDSTVTLQLMVLTSVQITEKLTLCEGGSVNFKGMDYSESGVYNQTVISNDRCENFTLEIEQYENPIINGVEQFGGSNYNILYIHIDEDAPYIFKLDSTIYYEPVLSNVKVGNHTIAVTNKYGCSAVRSIFLSAVIIPAEFFSPNANGINDRWVIENIELYPNATVRIYDRFGKKIFETKGYDNSNGWDGTYNGHALPSTDYWYEISVDEIDKVYVGHFTLIR